MSGSGGGTEVPVLIAGGGPVGLTTALLLAHHGVRSRILERRTTPSCGQSRAITVQRHNLALFDRLGIVEEMLRDGASWSLGRTYHGDREILRLRWPVRGEELYPAFVNFPQFRTEELLHAAAEATGMVEFRHGRTVLGVRQDATSVSVSTDGEAHTADYLVGADGIGSTVRTELGIPYEGWQTEGRFLVADFEVDLPFAVERRLWFRPPFYPSGIVLLHCMGAGKWRIDWQVDPGEIVDLDPDRMAERVRAVIGDRPFTVLRANTYTFQQRRAGRFRDGRVLLAGDAAHVVSPFGARGMNSGLEDAENLAWKLAFVLTGRAGPALLDSYAAEREPAADHHLEVTGNTMRFMTPATEEGIAHRDAVLRAVSSDDDPAAASAIDSGKLYEPYPYTASPLTCVFDDEPDDLGRPAPDGRCLLPGETVPTTLRKAVGGRLGLLAVPARGADGHALARRLAATPAPVHRYLLAGPEFGDDIPGVTVLRDTGTTLADAYAGDTDRLFVLRPDCYLAARAPVPDQPALDAAVSRALAPLLTQLTTPA
ncbi:FAD-dependent monooxygenase [Pseudonocardia acaciae]|uniref:FAD-dependent monooxygenase n=1 Tax=Pseudonocardia acaciae TaxID=551276 RepID=UPI000563014B|nr:FAD-dependent monooxygenase [Pseudonocardia acaciae]